MLYNVYIVIADTSMASGDDRIPYMEIFIL